MGTFVLDNSSVDGVLSCVSCHQSVHLTLGGKANSVNMEIGIRQ